MEEGFDPGIRDAGYRPLRIDEHPHDNRIDAEIMAQIRRSRFVVADFSCEAGRVRGGVYFEAGFALGLGLPVFWTVKKDCLEDLDFDTRQYPHLVWETPAHLRKLLTDNIEARLGAGPEQSA